MASATDGSSRPGQALDIRRAIDAIPALAWSSHSDGSVDFVNQRWHDYTGLSPEEAHGWGWKAAIHPEDLPMLMQKWEYLLELYANGTDEYKRMFYDLDDEIEKLRERRHTLRKHTLISVKKILRGDSPF
jgi:PAS domain-containing protein